MTAFTPELRRRLTQAIDDTPAADPISWNDVVRMAGGLGVPVTRQWLSRCDLVSGAYHRHQEAHRARVKAGGSANVDPVTGKLRELEKKLAQALDTNDLLTRQFIRWLYNARQKNVTVEDLERPVPKLELPEPVRPKGRAARA